MMELRHIAAGYGREPVITDISLNVQPGQITVVVGPNGCGKSTLLRVASRQLVPERGAVSLDGTDILSFDPKAFARRVALLPQSRSIPDISVKSLVLHGRFPYLGYPRRYTSADRTAARQAMELAGVVGLENDMVSQLSGGQRQKVYLAMAVAQDPDYLLLDEPTTYLDINHQLELLSLSRSLARDGRGIIMVLHDLDLALSCGDQVVVMDRGSIVQVGTPEEIYENGVLDRVFHVMTQRVVAHDGQIRYLFSK